MRKIAKTRHQLPAHSPLNSRALTAGIRALFGGVDPARERVRRKLGEALDPLDLLFTNSGTSALALALEAAAELRPGPAALPAYSCFDVATAAEAADVPVILYDLDPETLAPDLGSLRDALRSGASSLVVAHLYGIPVDMSEIRTLCAEAGSLLIEDAAQGAAGRVRGEPTGRLGSLSVLSFGRGKGLTGGGGGALLSHDEAGSWSLRIARRTIEPADGRQVAILARTVAQWLFGRPMLYGLPASLPFLSLGETVHRPPHRARGCPEVCLGILSETLSLADDERRHRRQHARRLVRSMEGHPELRPVRAPYSSEPGYLRLPVRVSDRVRSMIDDPAVERLGVMPGYPRPLGELPGFADRCRNAGATFPGAVELSARLCTFPTHSLLDAGDLRRLEGWIASIEASARQFARSVARHG